MTPLRRAPRQVYRVYSEAEFLAAEDWSGEAATEEWALDAAAGSEPSAGGRVARVVADGPSPGAWGRFAGVAALTGAAAAVAGVVVLSVSRSTVSRRGTLGLSASSRPPRSAASSAPSAPPPSSRPRGRDQRRHGRASRGPVAPRRLAKQGDIREVALAGTPVVAAPRTPAVVVTAEAPSPTDVPVRAMDTASNAAPVDTARSEFGFER